MKLGPRILWGSAAPGKMPSDAMIGDHLLDVSTGIEITVESVEMHLIWDVPWTTVQGRLGNGELLTFQGFPRRLTPWWQKKGYAVLPHPRPRKPGEDHEQH